MKKIEAVIEKVLPEQAIVLKAKVNTNHDVAFLFKRALWGLEDLVTLSTGVGVKNALSDKRSPQYGVQLDFNIWFEAFLKNLILSFLDFLNKICN